MKISSLSNSTNFEARLDVSAMNKNTKRWKNIAKIFAEKTKNSPNEVVIMDERWLGAFRNGDELLFGDFNKSFNDILKEKTDKQVATSLAKFLKLEKSRNNIVSKSINYIKFMNRLDEKLNKSNTDTNLYDILYAEALDKANKIVKNKADKDSILKNGRYY